MGGGEGEGEGEGEEEGRGGEGKGRVQAEDGEGLPPVRKEERGVLERSFLPVASPAWGASSPV